MQPLDKFEIRKGGQLAPPTDTTGQPQLVASVEAQQNDHQQLKNDLKAASEESQRALR